MSRSLLCVCVRMCETLPPRLCCSDHTALSDDQSQLTPATWNVRKEGYVLASATHACILTQTRTKALTLQQWMRFNHQNSHIWVYPVLTRTLSSVCFIGLALGSSCLCLHGCLLLFPLPLSTKSRWLHPQNVFLNRRWNFMKAVENCPKKNSKRSLFKKMPSVS